ncbi:MAG: deoxyuridine 5'-triphosphate nucleotidohydrolase [Dehalococcoidales bacterium]
MSVLSGNDIRYLLKSSPLLIEEWLNLDEQVQANGFDLTLRDVAAMKSAGTIAQANSQRVLSDLSQLLFDDDGFLNLVAGVYMVTYNEIVHLPKNIMALGRPRSSLLRCGVSVGTAVWDAGYEGRSQSLLMVHNPKGFRVQQNARITQLVFMELTGESEGYNGVYQGENI